MTSLYKFFPEMLAPESAADATQDTVLQPATTSVLATTSTVADTSQETLIPETETALLAADTVTTTEIPAELIENAEADVDISATSGVTTTDVETATSQEATATQGGIELGTNNSDEILITQDNTIVRTNDGNDTISVDTTGKMTFILDFDPTKDTLDLTTANNEYSLVESEEGTLLLAGGQDMLAFAAGQLSQDDMDGVFLQGVSAADLRDNPNAISGTGLSEVSIESMIGIAGLDATTTTTGDVATTASTSDEMTFSLVSTDTTAEATTTTQGEITGTNGRDVLLGDDSDNTLIGMAGGDALLAMGGDDILLGGTDGDVLIGGSGNDGLSGGAGDDVLFVDSGTNVIMTGDGADYVSITSAATGNSVVTDFNKDQDRVMVLGDRAFTLTEAMGDTTLAFDDGATVTFNGVSESELQDVLISMTAN